MHDHQSEENGNATAKATPRRNEHPGGGPQAHALLHLQRSVGNAATAQWLAESEVDVQREADEQRATVDEAKSRRGEPVDPEFRAEAEARTGKDFSAARVHRDDAAHKAAVAVQAHAFASGDDIFFQHGHQPKEVWLEELLHTKQQAAGEVSGVVQGNGLKISQPGDPHERAVDKEVRKAMSKPYSPSADPSFVQRSATGESAAARPAGSVVQRAAVIQRAPSGLSAAQQSLRDLAGRWKVQTFFAITTGRSNELSRVDTALAAWRQALDADPATPQPDLLQAIQQAITDWHAVKGTGSVSGRAVHIKSLAKRVSRALADAGSAAEAAELEERVSDLDEDEDVRPGGSNEGASESSDSEEEYFHEENSDWAWPSSESEGSGSEGEEPWMLSPNGRLAVGRRSQTQDFFAVPEVITEANAALSRRKSPLQLRKSGGQVPPKLADRGLVKVEPVMVVGGKESKGNKLLNVTECIEVARAITGNELNHVVLAPGEEGGERVRHKLQDANSPTQFTAVPRLATRQGITPEQFAEGMVSEDERFQFRWRGTSIDVNVEDKHDGDVDDAIDATKDTLAGAGMSEDVAKRLLRSIEQQNLTFHPALQQIMVDRLESDGVLDGPLTDELKKSIKEAAEKASGLTQSRYRPYEDAPDQDRDSRLGINDAAAPEIGEAYATFGTRAVTKDEQAAGKEANQAPPWKYHFAGVVAKDGDVTVTLENYTRHSAETGDKSHNERWYFGLYGPGRTFHGKHGETVTGAVTLAMG